MQSRRLWPSETLRPARRRTRKRRTDCRFELVERIDHRVPLRAVDADDAVEPGGHGNWFDDQRNQPPLSVAHVQDLADDRFFLAVAALEVARRNYRDGNTALADTTFHLL